MLGGDVLMEISLNNLEFPKDLKEKILTWTNTSKIEVTFVTGRKIVLLGTNMVVETPPKILFRYKNKQVVAHYDNKKFYLPEENESISFNKLIKTINTMPKECLKNA